MPVFLGVHDFGGPISKEQMEDNWKRYSESCKKHGAEAWKVYFNLEAGKAYCVTEAESADVVNTAHNEIDKPTKELIEVEKLKAEK